MGYIYVLKNKINDKMYVGQTTRELKNRIREYKCKSHKHIRLIHCAIDKYKLNNFKIYNYKVPNEMLDLYEKELIKVFNTISPNGYNLESGGNKNKKLSEETKEKLRNANLGKKIPDYIKKKISNSLKGTRTGKDNPMYGKKTKGTTGIIPSLEWRNKISNAVSGSKNGMYGIHRYGENATFYGRKHTEESKRKIGLKSIGRQTMIGKKHSEETKYKFRFRGVKPIIQYDLKGNKIKEYFSMMEAVRQNGYEQAAIQRACSGKQKTSYGYIWKYKEK